jgi:two-component system sensor histidine kinase YesM
MHVTVPKGGIRMESKSTWEYLPFGYKLMLSYCVFIIIPVLFIGYFANSIYVNSITEQTRTNIKGTLQQMKDNIAYKMENTAHVSDLMYDDITLTKRLRQYEEGWISYETTTEYLIPKIQNSLGAANFNLWLSIYFHNDTLPEIYKNFGAQDPLKVKSRWFDIYHIKRIKDKKWYSQYPKAEEYGVTMQWKQIEDDKRFERISLLRRMVDTHDPPLIKEVGFIRISMYLSDLLGSFDYQKIGNGTTIFIVDENRNIITSSGTAKPNEKLWVEGESNEHIFIEEILPGLNWNLVAQIPKDLIERDINKVRMLTIIICLVFLVVFFFVGIFISRYFANRVTKIVNVLDSFQQGDFQKRIQFKGTDEFTRIAVALNEMGQNIDDLIEEVYLTSIQKKEAEMESLQAQINPHFLYNTLSSISRLAKFGEADKLHQMVMDLSKFYRLSLNEGRTIIPISKEVEQIKAYIDIQKTKYDKRMSVNFDIQPDILQYTTVKLILQPFVENALEHAWCGDQIHIRIMGFLLDGNIVFKIIDDGIGMHPNLIIQILNPVDSLNVGYGIRNVYQRIKLHYGKEYGVSIFSRPGIGTTVAITIPLQTKEEFFRNDKLG